MSRCRDCGFTIRFVRMRTGRALPVDAAPDERGNVIALKTTTGGLADGHIVKIGQPMQADEIRYMPHHASCAHPKNLPKGVRRPQQDTLI